MANVYTVQKIESAQQIIKYYERMLLGELDVIVLQQLEQIVLLVIHYQKDRGKIFGVALDHYIVKFCRKHIIILL